MLAECLCHIEMDHSTCCVLGRLLPASRMLIVHYSSTVLALEWFLGAKLYEPEVFGLRRTWVLRFGNADSSRFELVAWHTGSESG
jgi:hypothetical protein